MTIDSRHRVLLPTCRPLSCQDHCLVERSRGFLVLSFPSLPMPTQYSFLVTSPFLDPDFQPTLPREKRSTTKTERSHRLQTSLRPGATSRPPRPPPRVLSAVTAPHTGQALPPPPAPRPLPLLPTDPPPRRLTQRDRRRAAVAADRGGQGPPACRLPTPLMRAVPPRRTMDEHGGRHRGTSAGGEARVARARAVPSEFQEWAEAAHATASMDRACWCAKPGHLAVDRRT